MKNSILTVALVGAVLVGSGVYAGATSWSAADEVHAGGNHHGDCGDCRGEKPQMRRAKHLALMNEVLDLRPDQQEQIEALLDEARKKHQKLRSRIRENRLEFRELTSAGSFDEPAVLALAARLAEQKAELLVERARVQSEIFALLTAEQQQKAQKFRDILGPRRHGKGRRL